MNKKHITHGKLKVFMILFLAVILIVLVVVCAKKIKLSQNEKNIIGTWKNSNSENVITVQDSDTLILYNRRHIRFRLIYACSNGFAYPMRPLLHRSC